MELTRTRTGGTGEASRAAPHAHPLHAFRVCVCVNMCVCVCVYPLHAFGFRAVTLGVRRHSLGGADDAQANLAALHRMRNQFMSVVQLHQEASLSITPRAGAHGQAQLVVVGYNAEGDGLGSHAHYLMGHLARLTGAGNVALLETDADLETQPDLDTKKVLVVVEPYRIHTREPRPRGQREYRVNLCLFESDRLPSAWAGELNTHSSEVWTTSSWLAQAFRASGVYVPIKVLPIGTAAPRLEPAWHASEHRSFRV